jgi:hypothetical protein
LEGMVSWTVMEDEITQKEEPQLTRATSISTSEQSHCGPDHHVRS